MEQYREIFKKKEEYVKEEEEFVRENKSNILHYLVSWCHSVRALSDIVDRQTHLYLVDNLGYSWDKENKRFLHPRNSPLEEKGYYKYREKIESAVFNLMRDKLIGID
ncbi:MAG: hypothetical protein AABX30_00110 [Nanoarchaeota archaeon]